jgi:hypothetical protein
MMTDRQHEMLVIFARRARPCEFGDIWDSYSFGDLSNPLEMVNFSRVADALLRRGLIARDVEDEALVAITDAGRDAIGRQLVGGSTP